MYHRRDAPRFPALWDFALKLSRFSYCWTKNVKTTYKEYASSPASASRNTDHWGVQDSIPTPEGRDKQVAREWRVVALRSWLDTLPDVPSVPAHAIDRSELY